MDDEYDDDEACISFRHKYLKKGDEKQVMFNTNQDIRHLISANHLRHWQIAYVIGVSENTLSRWFRFTLTKSRRKEVIKAIRILKKKRLNGKEASYAKESKN